MCDGGHKGERGFTHRVRTDLPRANLGWPKTRRAVCKEAASEQADWRIVGDCRSAGSPKYRTRWSALGSIAARSLGQLSRRAIWQSFGHSAFSAFDQTA